MRSKILKTDPAPFKATATTLFITGHVHAAFVFSEGDLALGARLGVGEDPGKVLALGAVFYQPLVHGVARHGPVRLLLALPAERRAARAGDVGGVRRRAAGVGAPLADERAFTPRRNAPCHLGVVVHPGAPLEGFVFF